MKALEKYLHPELLKITDFRSPYFIKQCENIADTLLNSSQLVVKGVPYRIREIEFYGFSEEHPDVYSQQHPQQKLFGYWHFHRMGKKPDAPFRMGTRKGLDLTLGDGIRFVGVLLRSIESKNKRIDGSSSVVTEILSHFGVTEVKDIQFDESASLELIYEKNLKRAEIFQAPRVGLFAQNKINWQEYVDHMYAPLRYITYPERTKKGRELLFLYQQSLKGKEFAKNLLSLSEETANRWREDAQSSHESTFPALLNEKLKTVVGRCKAYGVYLADNRDKK